MDRDGIMHAITLDRRAAIRSWRSAGDPHDGQPGAAAWYRGEAATWTKAANDAAEDVSN